MLLVLLLAEFAFARTINVPQDQLDISSAIIEAGNGDTILVAPGRYVENIVIENKKVFLLSHFVLDQSFEIISQTIIDGSVPDSPEYASAVAIKGEQANGTVVGGFTITGGIGTFLGNRYAGGGILICDQASPVITYNVITINSATCGGGMAVYNSSPIIEKNLIISNFSASGAGIDVGAASVRVEDNILASNNASSDGGAIRSIESPGSIFTDNIIIWNQAPDIGGILYDDPLTSIQYNNFWDNTGGDVGGTDTLVGDTTCYVNYNGIPCDSFFNLFRDPLITGIEGFSYATFCSSVVIDAGSGTNPEPVIGGLRTDIGPLEFPYLVGDLTYESEIDIDDLIRLIEYIFLSGPSPCPLHAGDWNCDGRTNIIDILKLVNYIFMGGPPQCSN